MSSESTSPKSLEDEARFWDETSVDELEGELEEVEVDHPNRPLSETFAVRLDKATVAAIRRLAARSDLGPTQLVRRWIRQAVEREDRNADAEFDVASQLEEIARQLRYRASG